MSGMYVASVPDLHQGPSYAHPLGGFLIPGLPIDRAEAIVSMPDRAQQLKMLEAIRISSGAAVSSSIFYSFPFTFYFDAYIYIVEILWLIISLLCLE